jgi:hypothetical protein
MGTIKIPKRYDELQPSSETTEAILEIHFIQEYLHEKGYRMKDLSSLPAKEARLLMKGACAHASNKLAEMNSKARLLLKMVGKKSL